MKNSFIIFLLVFLSLHSMAQDGVQTSIKNATEQYNQKKLLAAQQSLSKAVMDITTMLGAQVLAALPTTAGEFTTDGESDMNGIPGSDAPCASVMVTRDYLTLGSDANLLINITSNTNTAANISNAITAYSAGNTDPEMVQKLTSVNNLKALMTWDVESGTGDIQIAKGTTFIIITGDGFKDADSFIVAAQKIDFTKALEILGL